MFRFGLRRLAAAFVAMGALIALAPALAAEPLHLIQPAAGATLHGGAFATIEWSAAALPPQAEEWEAFLSIDGGRYYAFRITPHLDLDLRRFQFLVQNVDTKNARILIRTGDETRETLLELPDSFAIRRDAAAAAPITAAAQTGRGESARPGDPSVVAWADGDREGSRVAQQSASTAAARDLIASAPRNAPAPRAIAPKTLHAATHHTFETQRVARPVIVAAARDLPPFDLLLRCRRRNI
jgi:hypothetical protein